MRAALAVLLELRVVGRQERLGHRRGLFELGQGGRRILVHEAGAAGAPEHAGEERGALGRSLAQHRERLIPAGASLPGPAEPLLRAREVAEGGRGVPVPGGEGRATGLQHLTEERLGLGELAPGQQEVREVVLTDGDVRVPGGAGCAVDLHRFAEEGLGLVEPVLGLQKQREVGQAGGDLRVPCGEGRASDL